MATNLCGCFFLLLLAGPIAAQSPDSIHTQPMADSLILRAFMAKEGPAEAVFSFGPSPVLRFRTGVYTADDPYFPLLESPDSLVWQPSRRAQRRRHRSKVAAIATVLPLAILAYSVTRIVFALGTVATGQTTGAGVPGVTVIRASGIASIAGIGVTATFNIASLSSLTKAVRRHNHFFGRRVPTLFNPKGL